MAVSKVYDQAEIGPHHRMALEQIEDGSRVLEFGTATGYLTRVLREEKNCVVTGFEFSPDSARSASQFCERMIVGDIENRELWKSLEPPYAAVLFMDVLEHLRDPASVLASCRPLLGKNGKVIISIPNVAHWTVRTALLKGEFEYTDKGILDDTHLRFFTQDSLLQMIDKAGYDVAALEYIKTVFLGHRVFRRLLFGRALESFYNWADRATAHSCVYQFFVVCTPKAQTAA